MSRFDQYDNAPPDPNGRPSDAAQRLPFIGVLFECCGVYARIYRQPQVLRYAGRCPRCLRTLAVRVGPDGSQTRIFHAL